MKKLKIRILKNKPTTPAKSVTPAWKEKMVVALSLLGFVGLLALLATLGGIAQQNNALEAQLAKWKRAYHLTDEQAALIRRMELDFHGNGNPFTSRDSGTPEENQTHHVKMSGVMNPEDGERFLRDMKAGKGHE